MNDTKPMVMVVNDDNMVRSMLVRVLERSNFGSSDFENAGEAVAFYEQNLDKVDIVLLDMIMPEMDGHDCFFALKKINPNVRVIVLSGYCDEQKLKKMLDGGVCATLTKPVPMRDLVDTLYTHLA